MSQDHIIITDLAIHLPSGAGSSSSAFGLSPPPACPANLTLRIDLRDGIVHGDDDTMLGLGVNYSEVSKQVYAKATVRDIKYEGVEDLMRDVAQIPLGLAAVEGVRVELSLPRALLQAESVRYSAYFGSEGRPTEPSLNISDIRVSCIIGLHPHERRSRQRLEADLSVQPWSASLKAIDWADTAVEYLEQSSFGTIESLTHSLADHLLSSCHYDQPISLSITLRKPSALPFATPSITITRSSPSSSQISASGQPTAQAIETAPSASSSKGIFLALGSNIEPRLQHIQHAVRELESNGCRTVATGRLYESEPMYHTDQSRFLNSVIQVETSQQPMDLLRLLKRVERAVGRVKTFENGPRVVDVDLVYHNGEDARIGKKGDPEVDGVGWLQVPHWGRTEREFVLRPLSDIAPQFVDPVLRVPVKTLLARLPTDPPQLAPVIPFTSPSIMLREDGKPSIMAIFNATPDSFSDGSATRTQVESALQEVEALFDQPFPPSILDIGGMSTRPNSQPCSEEEELSRVVPLIKAIRASDESWRNVPISIDTYRASVARAAVEAGANCINDVRGGSEPGMLQVMAELDVPVVLMHSRGDSTSMSTPEMQSYASHGGVVEGVRKELVQIVKRAEKAGVKRWNTMLDPGLGFAKSGEDSLLLLRHLDKLVAKGTELEGYPLLVGASRKGFVGKVIKRDVPAERGFGDAAVAAWCAGKSVAMLRVHDARGAAETLEMTRAISEG